MNKLLLSILAGMIVGEVFTFFKLPLPAPSVFSAICGILVFGLE